jgi:adenylate kinase family enzyme
MQIHITGASGSGTTTLGLALSERLRVTHFETDDYFWTPSDPPFEEPCPMPERLDRLAGDLDLAPGWVLSGSLCGWGDPLIPRFDLVVFLLVPTGVRLARLRDREQQSFGRAALAPGGRMHANHAAFLEWAASYDAGGLDARSLARHTAWLAALRRPVVRFEGEIAVEKQVEAVVAALGEEPK